MRRLVVACLVVCTACTTPGSPVKDNVFGDGPQPKAVAMPRSVHLDWHGFSIDLEPTVELWAKQAHVDLSKIVTDAMTNIEGRLHGTPVPIDIEAGKYASFRALGIGGETDQYTGHVHVSMDLGSPLPLKDLLTVWVPLSLAHELHHSKRITDGPGYGATLREVVVTEGMAEAFARESYPDAPTIPWDAPLPGTDIPARFAKERNEPADPVTYENWFYGKNGLPRWAGYRLGYAMVESYLRTHPTATAASLATVPATVVSGG